MKLSNARREQTRIHWQEYWSKKENRERRRLAVIERWKNPDFRKKQKEGMAQSEKFKNAFKGERYKQRKSKISMALWADAEYRRKVAAGITEDARRKMAIAATKYGTDNPSWSGGHGYEPYCPQWKDREYKLSINQRDNHKCQHPRCWNKTKKLTTHHINYDKKDCRPANLISLCSSCNIRVNTKRAFWQSYFRRILRQRGMLCCARRTA